MKRQKRGKCKLWRSFTNIFKRRKSADATEVPEDPFHDVPDNFPPSNATEEEKISPIKPDDISKAGIPMKLVSPKKQKPLPKPASQSFAGDLDAVGRGQGLMNTDFAKDRLKIKPKTRVPAKYNQKQSFESSFEDLATVHAESQDESQNSRDDNSAVILDCGSGELSSSSDNTVERGAKVALLPKKPLPEAPHKKQPKGEETVEPAADFKRVSSKKKTPSGKSDDAKKFQRNSKSVEPEETVNLSISDGHRSRAGSEAKAAKGSSVKVTELNTGALQPPKTKPKAIHTGGGIDSNIRHSVSMKEVKRSMEKDASWTGVDISIAGGKSKASAVESSKLSSSAKEKKVASKAGSLSVESKPEAEETVSSTLEGKSKTGKHEAGLPPQGSFRKLSKTEKAAKGDKAESNAPIESHSEAKMDEESGLKRSLRRESKSKAEGKRVESVHAVLPTDSNFKRDSSRRSSARKSGQWNKESHDVLVGKNSAEEDPKKTAESKNEMEKKLDPMDSSTLISKPIADLQEGKELLTGKASGEAEKSFERSSNDLQVNAHQEKGSNVIEVHSIADIPTAEPISVVDSREMLNGKKGKEDGKKEKKSDSQIKRNNSNQKPEFVTPSVPAKAVQKGKDMRNDIQTATAETEMRSKLPAVETTAAADDVQKRMSKISISEENGTKEFNKVLHKVQNKPSNATESAPDSVETSSPDTTKTENRIDAISSATEKLNSKPAKIVPVPPKANPPRNDLGSSVKLTSADNKNAPSASLSSNRSNHSRTPSVTSGESKPQPETAETEKSKGDVVTSSSSSVKMKGPPPAVNRSGKVKAAESAKEPDNAWMERAKRMSKDFSDKMLQKVEIKTDDEKTADGETKTDDNFERGGTRSSVRDMVKKLQKPNQAS